MVIFSVSINMLIDKIINLASASEGSTDFLTEKFSQTYLFWSLLSHSFDNMPLTDIFHH